MNANYDRYSDAFRELRELEQDELPRSLRLFDIRLRLAIDIFVSFRGEVSLTKTKEVRSTYESIVRLMELWNAYEALSEYAKEIGGYRVKHAGKSKLYTQDALQKSGCLELLSVALSTIEARCRSHSTFNRDFEQYLLRIVSHKNLSSTLKQDAEKLQGLKENGSEVAGAELVSLIYAERNLYYHNGETAKMGMSYSNRRWLVDTYREVLVNKTLRLATLMFEERIDACR